MQRRVWIYAEKITGFYAFFRDFPRFYAQIGAVFTRFLASQARHELDAPKGLFACAKRGRIFTGGTNFLIRKPRRQETNRTRSSTTDGQN